MDVALLVGTDFNDGVRGIGPKTAVKRIREWGSLERAPPDVRGQLPVDLPAIREFFLHPPVTADVDLTRHRPDAEAVRRFLCDERDFSVERVDHVLKRLGTLGQSSTRLDDFS